MYERLKARAVGNNRSLEAELREILVAASKQVSRAEARARAAEIRQRLSGRTHSDSAELIRGGPRHPMSDATPAPTPVVVDASVGLNGTSPRFTRARRPVCSAKSSKLHVPSHFYVELASALWKKVMLRGELTEDQARDVRAQWTRFRS